MPQNKPYNPYASALNDARRKYRIDYETTFEKKILMPADIQRLEQLNQTIQRMKLLVDLYDVGRTNAS